MADVLIDKFVVTATACHGRENDAGVEILEAHFTVRNNSTRGVVNCSEDGGRLELAKHGGYGNDKGESKHS